MKRSSIGPGALSRERGSTFKQRKPLKKTGRVKAIIDRQASEAWARNPKPCAVCGRLRLVMSAHHIVTKQQLRHAARRLDVEFESLCYDRRNRLWLCGNGSSGCHGRHHSRHRPVSWGVLVVHAPKVFQFARETGELAWLERMYPKQEEKR